METQQKNLSSLFNNVAAWLYRRRHWLAIGTTLLAVYWCWQAAGYLQPRSLEIEDHRTAVRLLIRAGIALGIAVALSIARLTPPRPPRHPLTPHYSFWLAAIGGIAALAIVTEYNAQVLKAGWPPPLTANTQFILLCLGLLLLAWGLGGSGWRIRWRELGLVGVITLMAFGLRAWRLENAFPHFVDELNFATFVLYFMDNNKIGLLWPEVRGFPTVYSFLEMQTVQMFGRNLTGARAVSVVIGTLTIPALYLLAKELFDRPTAIIAALLLAVYPPHIHHSRLALNNIADPLFGTLAFAFYARAVRHQRRLDYALAGISLGLTQYFYEGGRLLYPPLLFIWMISGLWWWRPHWKGVIILVVAFIIVAAPIYLTVRERDQALTPRLESEAWKGSYWDSIEETGDTSEYLRHLKFSFLAIVTQPEWVAIYYGGEYGLVMNEVLPLLFLGLGIVLWQFYRPGILLAGWVLAGILGTSLLRHNVLTTRYVVIFPALILLIAVGLRYTPSLLRFPKELQAVVMGVLVMAIMGWQVHYYFGEHLELFNTQSRLAFAYDGEDALFRSREFPPGTHIYIISSSAIDLGYGRGVIDFFADDVTLHVVEPTLFTPEYIAEMPKTGDKAFFIEHFDKPVLDLLLMNFYLDGPYYSPYSTTPIKKQLALFYADKRHQQG
ncbi:MAG: glycosyltransferase family 39 protein [Anaerolineales bacterium]|nr:glycosyltransferase family 39 protein [Anaerolineales bacterium]